jgi:hypothetical protein
MEVMVNKTDKKAMVDVTLSDHWETIKDMASEAMEVNKDDFNMTFSCSLEVLSKKRVGDLQPWDGKLVFHKKLKSDSSSSSSES